MPAIPPPPHPLPEPRTEKWPAGKPIIRCHDSNWGATEFNSGLAVRRFRPFATPVGHTVGTMYGSDLDFGALSETVFHNVPVRGPDRTVDIKQFDPWLISAIVPHRPLLLAKLRGTGLRRLEITHAELIETSQPHYEETIPWAKAIWGHPLRVDGLIWMSRQHNESAGIILFERHDGRGVERSDLTVVERPMTITDGKGLDRVQRFADEAGIEIRGI